jgi:hypothetical protein
LSAYLNVVIPQQPALSNDGKQWQPALGDFTSPIVKKNLRHSVSNKEKIKSAKIKHLSEFCQ